MELKRYNRVVDLGEIVNQVSKYNEATTKCLQKQRLGQEHEIIVVLGQFIKGHSTQLQLEKISKTLEPHNARVVYYDTLISDASTAYKAFFEKRTELNPIIELFKKLEDGGTD